MLSVKSGKPIAALRGGSQGDAVLGITENGDSGGLGRDIELRRGVFEPIMPLDDRSIDYVAGPSGAGKSTYVAGLLRRYQKLSPKARVLFYSRGPVEDDKAYDGIELEQVALDAAFVESPPDVTRLEPGTVLVYDDVGTVQDDKVKEAVLKSIMDCAEVGRKYSIHLVVTSHLVNPNEKKFSRTMMNEMKYLTVFPGSGNSHSIRYVLKTYLGLDSKQIQRILDSRSRWVRVHTHAPRWVMGEREAYVL